MRQIEITDYIVKVRNERGVARFVEKQCECGQDLTTVDPVNPKVESSIKGSGECPNCGQVQPLIVPEYLDVPYHVRDSLIELLMARDNQLSGKDLLERDVIARKILDCTDGHVLLEEEEWSKLNMTTGTVRGLGRSDVELIRRIVDAKQIEVEAKQKEEQE